MTPVYTQKDTQGKGTTGAGDNILSKETLLPQKWMSDIRIPESAKRQPLINANQQTSINAMILYISHKSGQSEFRIERRLADHFHVPNATLLQASDFDNAIRYLADMIAA